MRVVTKRRVNGLIVEYTIDGVPQPLGTLGDKIAAVATPIARALKLPCIDKKTNELKPESGCAKMKQRLNAGMPIAEAVKNRIKGI